MANRNSRVTLFEQRIMELEEAQITALVQTAEYIHTETVQAAVVPRDSGALQNEKFFVDDSLKRTGKVSLIFEGPYARRLYFHPEYKFNREDWEETVDGRTVRHGSNPNAKGRWMDDWKQGGQREQDVVDTFREFYRREANL